MAERHWTTRIGLTPAKGLLVAGLACTLIAVLLWPAGDDPAPAPRRRPSRRPSARADERPQPTTTDAIEVDESVWTEATEPIRFDPFAPMHSALAVSPQRDDADDAGRRASGAAEGAAVSASSRRETSGRRREERDDDRGGFGELRRQGVTAVFTREGRQAALIGDRVVTVGDVIDGYRVVSIGERGVSVEIDRPEQP